MALDGSRAYSIPDSKPRDTDVEIGKLICNFFSLALVVIPILIGPTPEGSNRLFDLLIRGGVIAGGICLGTITNIHQDSGPLEDI